MDRSYLFIFSLSLLVLSCVTGKIRDGQQAFELKKYDLAAELLVKDFKKADSDSLRAALAYKAGLCFQRKNDMRQAENWFRKAANLDHSLEALEHYANALQINEKLEEAAENYRSLSILQTHRRSYFDDLIKICRLYPLWAKDSNRYQMRNVHSINTNRSEHLAQQFKNSLVFVSNRSGSTGETQDFWTGEAFYDLFAAEMQQGVMGRPQDFDRVINSPFNEGAFVFNKEQDAIFFTRCGTRDKKEKEFCEIYFSRLLYTGWTEPEALELFDEKVNVGHPALSPDGKLMIFSAGHPSGYGGNDLYYSKLNLSGWSTPINLGKKINSNGDELFPYLDDSLNLYFASNGHPGLGGLDIYISLRKNDSWIRPVNLKSPLNSTADDFGIYFMDVEKEESRIIESRGYISSSRSNGRGSDDIWSFTRFKPPMKIRLEGTIYGRIHEDPDNPNSPVVNLAPLPEAEVELLKKYEGDVEDLPWIVASDEKGRYFFELDVNTAYKIRSVLPGYLSKAKHVNTSDTSGTPGETIVLKRDFILDRIYPGQEVEIENIYYDYDKWNIRPDAALILDSLYLILAENPSLEIELGSHTDARGSDEYNRQLSQNRAQSAVNYLVNKGIEKARLSAKGYGESHIRNHCKDGVNCNEKEHQENRRTTFKVTGLGIRLESE